MPLYAGFDCSTQSLSVVVIDSDSHSVVYRDSLAFDEPWLRSADQSVVHAAPTTWTAALEEVFDRLTRQIDCRALAALSGSAQQHGSVYCGATPDVLTRETSPIWMDTSTARECDEIEAALGGPAAVAQLTGSRAFPRFTGPQIRKFAREQPEAYVRTARIHLVSSYLASVLVGSHMAVDHADASGMNLMDIRRRQWSSAAVGATAADLGAKLPDLVPSASVIGTLSTRWQHRFHMPAVAIVAWSGDNPCSLVGTGLLKEGQLAISLGTSDTIFGPMREPRISANGIGHVFVSPFGDYMGITVFRNGSLARERIRNQAGMNWAEFSAALRRTAPGNGGAMMLPWFEPEITPHVPRGSARAFGLDAASPAQVVRAVVEGQVMALARHSEWMGVTPQQIYATGGAAENRDILQVIADVFNADVYQFESTDAAAIGAAIRAFQAHAKIPWPEAIERFVAPVGGSRIAPAPAHVEIYRRLRPAYALREAAALQD